ncbi:MAG: hypothetical protein H7A41_00445 [Chlamydiales bacterium]|nr:hypothetical protein [Chlamydiia bacterium]MCP5503602.1 hypothetical protein [Chlamydiales bacterium]
MRSGNLLFSAVHFFVIFLIFGMGALFLALPYADYFRIQLMNLLIHPSDLCYAIGGALIGFGALLFILLYLMNRRSYFQVEMRGTKVQVDEKVIRDAVSTYFKALFPGKNPVNDIAIKGKSMIELIVSLPQEKEEDFLEKVEEELGEILARRLGYQNRFLLTFVET